MPKLEVVNANNVIEFNPQKANFKLKNTGGPKGEPGAQGPKGDTGPQGPAGPQGIQGEKGDKGAQGERGPQGIQGPQGPQGIQGPKGDKGDKGNTGATGPQGPQGPAGQNGTDGQDGADGFSPIATVTQEGLDAEISITDKNGTTTATVPGFSVQTVTTLPATGTENIIYLKRTEATASGKSISVSDAVEAPLADFQLKGETSQNGTPAPDAPVAVQTVTGENMVKICGKNLFDKSKATLGYRIGGDGTPYADSPYFISDFIPVKASTAYHINTANVGGSSAIATYDKDKVFIRRILGNGYQNIVTDANALYIRFATSQTVIDQAQLELGSSASSFEPYQDQSYPISLGSIELCKIGDYQDSIYKSGGKWYVHKAVGKYRLESDKVQSAYLGRYRYAKTDIPNSYIPNNTLNFKMSHFTVYTYDTGGIGSVYAGGTMINMKFDENGDNISGFRDWVANNDVLLYYPLATPTDTEITNEALIEQLEAILSQGYTYAGTNNITTVISAGNEQGELTIGYYNAYDSYLYVAGRWQQFARLTAANE